MSTPPLFDRLPPLIFRPLAAANGRRYWTVLARLVEQLWGPGAHAAGEEVERSKVIRIIESHLIHDDPWLDEDGARLESPVLIRAHEIYTTFREAGWLAERRRGLRDMVTMRPIVAQFYETLADFAERGPEFLGSRVRSIHLNLRLVVDGKGDGSSFLEAARQAHSMWTHIANTGVQVYELMESLQRVATTREFVDGFFEGYIQKIFIGDYLEIRTSNHPLQHRTEIITDTLRCAHVDELAKALRAWYTQRLANNDEQRGERLFQRDVERLMRLQDVEQHLQRLDEEIRAANQRALVYLEYKSRSPRSFDQLLVRASRAVARLPDEHMALPDALLSEPLDGQWLAVPPTPARADTGSPIVRSEPSIEAIALDVLRKRMVDARLVSPVKLARYVARHLGAANHVTSDALTIDSILDLACYQRLLLMAARTQAPPEDVKADPYANMVPGMRVQFRADARTANRYFSHRQFVVVKEKRA